MDSQTGQPLTGAVDVQDGYDHGCAALADGTVACWSTVAQTGNAHGQLGNGAASTTGTTFRATPVLSAANTKLTGVRAVVSGNAQSSCAITESGALYCWGDLKWLVNDGEVLDSAYAQVITTDGDEPLEKVIDASVNAFHACALVEGDAANEVWCWGYNLKDNLAQNDTENRQYPVQVLGLDSPTKLVVGQFGSGADASCVLDGSNVRCWGSNGYGRTGVGSDVNSTPNPQLVVKEDGSPLDEVVDVFLGGEEFCALREDGRLWCWGREFANYAENLGVANVVTAGHSDSPKDGDVRFLTSDGNYHVGTVTRPPNCGEL